LEQKKTMSTQLREQKEEEEEEKMWFSCKPA